MIDFIVKYTVDTYINDFYCQYVMDLSALAAQPGITDVLVSEHALYVITTGPEPLVFSDKNVVFVHEEQLLSHENLPDILQAESVKRNTRVSRLRTHALYEYSLTELDGSDKQRFSHALNGTGGRKGLLAELGAQRLGRGVVLIREQEAKQLEAFFDMYGATYSKRVILMEEDDATT